MSGFPCAFSIFVRADIAQLIHPVLYASDSEHSRLTVFFAAATALVLTSALGVLGGAVISEFVSPKLLRWIAGGGFIAVGIWVLIAGD
jgi:putative Ca2+/H+ antiporter (TMEM165/GDT1 family)